MDAERVEEQRIAAIHAGYDPLLALRCHDAHDQFRFQQDLRRLDGAGIRYWIRGAGITTLFVHPDGLARAEQALEAAT